jgi:hypothetical protein
MRKLRLALSAAVKGFHDAFAPCGYTAGGKRVRCFHCDGEVFTEHEALLNTTGATAVGLDWLDKSGTALMCANCGFLLWFGKKVERLQA